MLIVLIMLLLFTAAFPQDGLIKSYYSDGNVKSEINYRDSVREGEAKFFSENGNIKEERIYLNGRVEGIVKIYSDSGKLKEVFVIENGRRDGPTNIFDENGIYVSDVNYEEGKLVSPSVIEDYYASSNDVTESNTADVKVENTETKPKIVKPKKTSDELLLPPVIEEEKMENDPAFFATIEIMPEPVGGMEAIYKKLIYPSAARNNEIKGTVKVQAFVDEYGEVMEAEVVEGIGYGCDDVARDAIYYAKFRPGLQKGRPVRAMIIIPIEFKPEMEIK